MAYYQLNDIKRDRLPYATSNYWKRPVWAPEIYNTPLMNVRNVSLITALSGGFVEIANHLRSNFYLLNYIYETPKNSLQWSIYIKEIFKVPYFYTELRKKLVYGAVQHTLDAGFKISMFHYVWGGTYSPYFFADFHSIKMMSFSFLAGFLSGWTNYPLAVARRAYYADLTYPEEMRKGFRSPLHALVKIPFVEGPLYLFRGGWLHYMGNSIGFGWIMYSYLFLKDKLSFLWRFNGINYNYIKFLIFNFSFAIAAMGSQPFFRVKELLDTGARERGGNTAFRTTYEAFRYLKKTWYKQTTNMVAGYWTWFRAYGAILYIALWNADNAGFLTNFKVNPNHLETTCARMISD